MYKLINFIDRLQTCFSSPVCHFASHALLWFTFLEVMAKSVYRVMCHLINRNQLPIILRGHAIHLMWALVCIFVLCMLLTSWYMIPCVWTHRDPFLNKMMWWGSWGQLEYECTNGQALEEKVVYLSKTWALWSVSCKYTFITYLFCTFYQFCVFFSLPFNILYIIEKDTQI